MSIEIKFFRSNRIFRPNEPLEGKVVINLDSSISHRGIRLKISGSVNLQVRGGSAGIVESFYGVIKPIPIVNKSVEVQKPGRIGSGTTEIPFSVVLKERGEEQFEKYYETFHGGNLSIQYLATVDIIRGYLQKSLSATMEFIIESEKDTLPEKPISPEMVFFYITQDTQRHLLLSHLKLGEFKIIGKVCSQCSLADPIVGELTVDASSVPIQSIDIHLLRVESILIGEKIATETSLIQTIQIADGDVCKELTLPIYIILPRLLTCPTTFAGPFSIEFKMTIVITFQSELSKLHHKSDFQTPTAWTAMESIPLELVRTK
ncbi:vacuolar protein sorting-associated protein 26C isoform X1 [Ipomoea triloba]|uniref:vacuolar protein sorting-associated protein 26C isoform X1 n=1 Tax=Ipomoea triloba TaxID=35885 RepID=UPI00125D7544|nr:vacuolar protein sorting-associated protein 26C isoform X1 [Ipomoea triloba]XP_031106899.1 vacuolar protein sorting-associated protein 26C isoform X1 [Ipomoea triloba]XP_031106900.1 vacuolar protein sorting-associated protein 26C isoform X1 [Ipomoea triloba]XP_031106901.1 vacuolar protein sorting-associated protein 26C isoform X1 [Ipomoea triloba]GLL21748.1 Down syndrome critical region protein 3 homolog isoform X1 [Ipomoea trifida]